MEDNINVKSEDIEYAENIIQHKLGYENNSDFLVFFLNWFNTLPMPTWIKSPEGKLLALNKICSVKYGIKLSEVINKYNNEYLTEETSETLSKGEQKILNTLKCHTHLERITNPLTGKKEFINVIRWPVYHQNGELLGIAGMILNSFEVLELVEQNIL